MQKPTVADAVSVAQPKKKRDASGRVQFDSRGQAVWAWEVRTGIFDLNASTSRVRALAEPSQTLQIDLNNNPPVSDGRQDAVLPASRSMPPLMAGEDPGGDPYASADKRK